MLSNVTFYFIHGFPDSEKVWQQYSLELKKNFPEAEYLYFSSPQTTKVESLGQLKELHLQALKGAVEAGRRIVIVAHDLGVPQAWIIAKFLQDSLGALFLYNGLSVQQLKDRWSDLGQVRKSWYIGAFLVPGLARLLMQPKKIEKQLSRLGKKDPDFRFEDYYLYRLLAQTLFETPVKLKAPVFQLSSRKDPFIQPLKNTELETQAFNYQHEIFDGGHWSIQENPAHCVRSAVDFLNREMKMKKVSDVESL